MTNNARLTHFACTLVFASALSAFCIDFAQLDLELRSVIENRQTTDEDLLQAISRLGKVTEKSEFWQKIADDPSYTRGHRRRAIFALFRRHHEAWSNTKQVAAAIAPAKWLLESQVTKVTYLLGGGLPVDLNFGESVFAIYVLGGSRIFVSVPGDIDAPTFSRLLRNERAENSGGGKVILQVGFGDDYDDWLNEKPSRLKSDPVNTSRALP